MYVFFLFQQYYEPVIVAVLLMSAILIYHRDTAVSVDLTPRDLHQPIQSSAKQQCNLLIKVSDYFDVM